jgi:hypothetical protein
MLAAARRIRSGRVVSALAAQSYSQEEIYMSHTSRAWKTTEVPLTDAAYERIEELNGDPGYRAAFHILVSRFPQDRRVWRFVNLQRPGIDFRAMLGDENNSFAGGEERLLRVAASLFNGARVSLSDVCGILDDRNFAVVVEAMRLYRRS